MYNNYKSKPKTNNAEVAKKWIETLKTRYSEQVNAAIESTHYVDDLKSELEINDKPGYDTQVLIFKQDVSICTKAGITRLKVGEKLNVLDFASYTNPGGGFIKGAHAQEEDICNMSGLYLCLAAQQKIYDKRKNQRYDGLYGDDYFYVKDCPFIIDGKSYLADVTVLAAVNAKATRAPYDEVESHMRRRMKTAFLVPYTYGCTHLILGAFGCGVFGNDVKFVAETWLNLLQEYKGLYKNVVFAVIDPKMKQEFTKILGPVLC